MPDQPAPDPYWKTQPSGDGSAIHVYPLSDTHEHVVTGDPCPCLPVELPRHDGERDPIYRHNSYDGREVGEVCRRALDLLGVKHRPPWTIAERSAYEYAIQLLDMHWPKDETESNERGTAFPFRPAPPTTGGDQDVTRP